MGLDRKVLDEMFQEDPDLITFTGFDDAIIGTCFRFGMQPVIIYDVETCLATLTAEGMSYDDAVEYFEFNVLGAWVGDRTPAFLSAPLLLY